MLSNTAAPDPGLDSVREAGFARRCGGDKTRRSGESNCSDVHLAHMHNPWIFCLGILRLVMALFYHSGGKTPTPTSVGGRRHAMPNASFRYIFILLLLTGFMLPAESSDSPLLNLYTAKSLSPQSENEAPNRRERGLGRVAVGAEVDAAAVIADAEDDRLARIVA